MYRRFDAVHLVSLCPPVFSLFVIFGAFYWDFHGKDLEVFLCRICFGNAHEVGVPLFLVILPLKSRSKAFNFGDFRVLRVLVLEARD
jgi:hypothetical protein